MREEICRKNEEEKGLSKKKLNHENG